MPSSSRKKPGKKVLKYCLPDGTHLGQKGPDKKGGFTCYEVYDAGAETLCEFLHKMVIGEVDDHGKTIATARFHEAPLLVQTAILRLTGLTWKDVRECEEPSTKAAAKPAKRSRSTRSPELSA